MSWWRRYLDLWIVCALLCGLFAVRQGGVTLAEVGPRVRDFGTFVSAKLTEFAAVAPAAIEEAISSPPVVEAPAAGGVPLPAPPTTPLPNAQSPAPVPQVPLVQQTPGPVFVPFCPQFHSHCGWR